MNTSLGKYSTAVGGEAGGGLAVVHRRFLAAASSQAPDRKLPVQGESCLHRQSWPACLGMSGSTPGSWAACGRPEQQRPVLMAERWTHTDVVGSLEISAKVNECLSSRNSFLITKLKMVYSYKKKWSSFHRHVLLCFAIHLWWENKWQGHVLTGREVPIRCLSWFPCEPQFQ